jgi:hypothetical protein
MKLSKDFINEVKERVIDKIKAFGSGNNQTLLTKILSLFPHIEALEQELTETNQTNLQRLEEVKGLQRNVESLTTFSNQKVSDVRRLNESTSNAWAAYSAELQARMLLELQLERAMLDHQPVVLPKEVAEAIKFLTDCDFSEYGIILDSHAPTKCRMQSPAIRESLHIIREFTYLNSHEDAEGDSGADLLLKALVNGYTVEPEQTPEEKVLGYFETITPKDWKFSGDGNYPVYIARDAIRTTCYFLGKEIEGITSKQ